MTRQRNLHLPVVIAASAAFGLAIAGIASSARTQDAAVPPDTLAQRISGNWERAISEAEGQQRVERGIAGATEGMPPLVDAIAARALRERTHIAPRVEITATPARISIFLNNARYDTAPGHPRTMPVPGGEETMQVVQHFREGHLEQVFTTEDGRRWSTFVPSADGNTMTLNAVIQSSRLSAPMRFSIPYRRIAAR